MTTYKVIYELSNRIKVVEITAHSPMEALHKFKAMMPKIVYKNLALKQIDEVKEPEIKNRCFDCIFKIA